MEDYNADGHVDVALMAGFGMWLSFVNGFTGLLWTHVFAFVLLYLRGKSWKATFLMVVCFCGPPIVFELTKTVFDSSRGSIGFVGFIVMIMMMGKPHF